MADFVEASRAIRQAEVGASQTMIERTEACFGIKPEWLAADTAYGSAANLDWLVNQQGIAPHVPVIDKSQREDGTFSREDFIYDAMRDGRLRLPSALSPQKSEAEKKNQRTTTSTKLACRAPRHRRAHHSTAASTLPALPKVYLCENAA
jgi:hypothetical protein